MSNQKQSVESILADLLVGPPALRADASGEAEVRAIIERELDRMVGAGLIDSAPPFVVEMDGPGRAMTICSPKPEET